MSVDRAAARQGVIDALPLFVPAIPFGLVIGLAITESGMNPFVGWSGSWLIFGGAAQLTLVTLLGSVWQWRPWWARHSWSMPAI